jgi:hypothetical protein
MLNIHIRGSGRRDIAAMDLLGGWRFRLALAH